MGQKDYYKILGIPADASTEDIKKSYRKLVHKYHPDIAGNTPENIARFKEITEAYETLSSYQKREQYDSIRKLYEYAKGNNTGSTAKKDSAKSKTKDDTLNKPEERVKEGKKFEDKQEPKKDKKDDKRPQEQAKQKKDSTFNKMRDQAKTAHNQNIFTNFMQNLTKSQTQRKYVPPKIDGKDITTEVTLSVEEAINGTERVVNILHMETCDKCKGRKFINGTICSECSGKGEKSKYKKLTVKIPAQVKHNSKIRVEGEGNKGFNGGKRGNLYLIVKIENAQDIEYDGLNILRTISIAPYEAVLGGFVNFEMNGEMLRMKIMPMSYSGQKYRIADQGLDRDGKKGDLIVTVKIDIPKNISKEEIELYERLKKIAESNVDKA